MVDAKLACEFIEAACAELRVLITPTEHSWRKPLLARFANGYRFEEGSTDFGSFFWRPTSRSQFGAARTFAQRLEVDPRYISLRGRVQYADDPGNWAHPESICISLLIDYLHEVDTLKYNPDVARDLARNFISSLETLKSPSLVFIPVSGINDPSIDLRLGNVRLQHVSDLEICRRRAYLGGAHASESYSDLLACTTWAVGDCEVNLWDTNFPVAQLTPEFKAVLCALRILKDSDVEFGGIYSQKRFPGSIRAGFGGGWQEGFGDASSGYLTTYTLEKGDNVTLQAIFRAITNKSLPKKLNLAVERLNYSKAKKSAEDKILHALIALECLFGDGSGAIGYKIGMRASALLFSKLSDRVSCKQSIEEAYGIRSALVHGKSWVGPTDTPEVVSIAASAVRSFALSFEEKGSVPSADYLDQLLLE